MKHAYLTIDDGPSIHMKEKVDVLESKNIKAVWFCRGDFLEIRPDHAVYAMSHGHIIGNHSYSHPKFSDLELKVAYEEIDRTDQIIEQLYERSGIKRPMKAFRFPYGDKGDLRYGDLALPLNDEGLFRKEALQQHLRSLGYSQPAFDGALHSYHRMQHIFRDIDWRWTFDALEWGLIKDHPPEGIDTVSKLLSRISHDDPTHGRELMNDSLDEVILMHDQEHSRELFPRIIETFLKIGLNFQDVHSESFAVFSL